MSTRPLRWSWTTMWAVAIVVLLPALAWLQYSWLDQIAAADRERRERTVRTSATQLAQAFDLELAKAFFALQVDNGPLGDQTAAAYAARYAAWASSATNPRMVRAVYRAALPPNGSPSDPLRLQQWNPTDQRFDPVDWPAEMQTLASRLGEQLDQIRRRALFRRGEGPPPTPFQPDDPAMMIGPIVHVGVDAHAGEAHKPSEISIVGFTVVQLDLAVLAAEMLPTLVRRHFADENGNSDFRVAVVNGTDNSQVLFESEGGAAAAALDQPDATTSLMSGHGRPFLMFARGERGERGIAFSRRFDPPMPPPPSEDGRVVINIMERRGDGLNGIETRMLSAGEAGHWRLVAKHRAGSLEAAVSSARTRNFALSSGILLLLSAAVGLIIVSARRADRLGRQQMEFVATVSHELRTPVSVIGAAAGNLADGVVADPSRVRQYGGAIQGEARRLAETVERVLQLAGIASGRAISRERLGAAALVDDALNASSAEIEAAGFDVDVDLPDHLPLIDGDRAALRSALQNLIGNALKYGRAGQWMGIHARAVTLPSGYKGRQQQPAVEISVTDRGPGIAVDDRPHIFEAFYRGRHAVTHQFQGSGLGLHLVQRIVEAHGGRVTVECDPGPSSSLTRTGRASGAPGSTPTRTVRASGAPGSTPTRTVRASGAPGCQFTITLPAADTSAASQHDISSEVPQHDPSAGHPALEPRRSH